MSDAASGQVGKDNRTHCSSSSDPRVSCHISRRSLEHSHARVRGAVGFHQPMVRDLSDTAVKLSD